MLSLFKAAEHHQPEGSCKMIKAEIQVRLSDRTSESDGIKLYSLYCYPSSIKVFPWYQLVLYPNESDLSKLSKPHVLLHKIKKDVRETASSIYSKYAHSPNLKLLLILSSTITQKHLDSDKELKDCPITVVIIPEKYKHLLKDFTKDVTKQYEVSVKPVISAQVHLLYNDITADDVLFKKRIHEIIQERMCITIESIDDPSGKPLRLLKWILDKVNLIILDLQTEVFSLTFEDVIHDTIKLLVDEDHIDSLFSKDFIFYSCFASILHPFYSLETYPDNLKLLIFECVSKLVKMKPSDIAALQQEFIDMGSFSICDSYTSEINVFHFAAKAFVAVSQHYLLMYPDSKCIAHVRILSVSIAIKFYNSCSMLNKIQKIWTKEVLQHFITKGLSECDVESFSNGLKAMSCILKHQPQLMLTWENVSTLFTAKIFPIKILWNFVAKCNEYLTRDYTGVTFAKTFFSPIANFYEAHLSKWDNEGPDMLENIVGLIATKGWDFDNFFKILNLWLAIFVKSIDLTCPESKKQIEILIWKSQLWPSYATCLDEKLQQLFIEKCPKLSIDDFNNLIVLGDFDKIEAYKTFINSVSYSMNHENSFMNLLCLASKYLIERGDPQETFLSFFYKIGSYYIKSNQSLEFIQKLLEVEIFVTSEYFDGKFGKMFKNFVIDNKLEKEIYDNIFFSFSKIALHNGTFQYEVIKVLLEEVIFSVGHVTDDAVIFFCRIFSQVCNFSVKVRAALIVFGKVVLSQSPSIEWLSDNATKLFLIARTISNFKSDDLILYIPESKILKDIITQFNGFLRKLFDAMEKKHITFGQLEALFKNHLTYSAMYDCTVKLGNLACSAITKEEVQEALQHQSKILKLLVKEPIQNASEGSFVMEVLLQYDIFLPTILDHLIKSNIVLTKRNTQTSPICTCEIKNECTLNTLESIASQLEAFLQPITDSLETLVLLYWKGSAIFDKCIKHYYKHSNKEGDTDLRQRHFSDPPTFNFNCSKKLRLLNDAVLCAKNVFYNLIKDDVSILTINEIFTMQDVKSIDWSKETKMLHECFSDIKDTFDVEESLQATFELIELYLYALAMQQAFKVYKLEQCLVDIDDVVKDVNYVKYAMESTFTTLNAKRIVKNVKTFFGVKDIIGNPYFQLFVSKHIKQLRKLYEFACERGYQSDDGYQTFRLECQLVTVELLHENHDEQLLSAFQNTMSLVFPFLKHETSLLAFWNDIVSIGNISEAISQLSFVNEGMNVIRMWFNLSEEEAPQNNGKLLRSIQSSGVYNYKFSKENGVQLTLTFINIQERGHIIPQQCFDTSVREVWTVSTINNFSRRLSFVNFKSSFESLCLKWFIQLKKFAFQLFDCYSDLHCSGHPEYRKEEIKEFHLNPCFLPWRERGNIHLCVPPDQWDSWVYGWQEGWGILTSKLEFTKLELSSFKSNAEKFRKNYPVLSFLSTKRLISIYERITDEFCDDEILLHEIGFLIILDMNGRSCLKSAIKMIPELLSDANVHPVERVGSYLHFLLQSDIIKPYLSKCVRSDLCLNKKSIFKISLISAFNYSNLELMNLILWIFEELPSYFQVLRCSVATIEEDIELFFDRINHFSQKKYLILGVDTINNELQRVLLKRCSLLRSNFLDKKINYSLFLVEYSPSLFCHIQWIDEQEISHMSDVEKVREKCKLQRLGKEFREYKVIYGPSGCGKTHYIKSKIKDHMNEQSKKTNKDQNYLSISIDETFSRKEFFNQLTKVSLQQYGMLYYYNVSLFLPEESDENYKMKFNQLVEDVNWFFFDYFVLGYVEISVDTQQQSLCRSLCLPSGMSTDVYIEVPYWNVNCDVTKSFSKFCELFPALTLLGELIIPKMEFDIEHYKETQLVCKYLKASQNNDLDHLYTDFPGQRSPPVKIGNNYKDLSAEECRSILQHNFKHSIAQSKLLQAVYLKYMERRCQLLEDCFQLCFLQDVKDGSLIKDDKGEGLTGFNPKNMRSTLFNLMKEEVEDFCKSSVIQATDEHQQVIYDVDKNGGIVFKFFCTGIPSEEKRQKLRAIGVKLEPMTDCYFHDCLSAALNVKKDDSNCITLIKEKKFVLTKDFVRKMLTIHERRECGMPVILEGETGVGKTFLLQMLSSLWNDSWKQQFLSLKNDMQNFLYDLMTQMEKKVTIGARTSNLILTVKTDLKASERKISFDTLCCVLQLAISSDTYAKIRIELLKILYDPIVANIELPTDSCTDKPLLDFLRNIQDEKETCDTKSMANVINGILYGKLKSVFYKLSLHSDMKPKKIEEFLVNVNQHALLLLECYKKHNNTVLQYQKPIITVFFDEINTSSCPGYLKEIIIDKAVNGRALAENIFIVAACNPHRGNSLAMLAKQNDSWLNASYYVQSLPHTLNILKWEYGQLEAKNEEEYIRKMLLLTYENRSKNVCKIVAEIIARAQELMRAYASKHLKSILNTESYLEEKKVELYAKSTVSQRDIKRVFQLHGWLETWFKKDTKYGKVENDVQIMTRAFYVAIALVYYFRLNICDREDFKDKMMCYASLFDTCGQNFVQSLNDELNWVDRVIDFSAGIAPTLALKENIYAIIVCTMARIPVFIVGPPGSSKTLSFKIAVHNCQGQESKNIELKDCSIFKCLDPHLYQCSRKSTSSEIETVFKRAINRQQTIDKTRRLAVVMMDEAGLPEDSHESLKVLHHLLDDEPLVSFVGISNDILDAAKTNRTVTIYRSEISSQDLVQLAKYSLTSGNLPIAWNKDEESMINSIVEVYENLINDSRRPHIRQFFGLRDFIHFFAYLGRSKNHQEDVIKPQAVMEALGHNFNGTKDFNGIVQVFFKAINFNPENVRKQSLIQLLQSSFKITDRDLSSENQVRYKLLIDSSEDQSLVRLLFRFDIFQRDTTKILSCSRFPFDNNSQKLYTTAAIRHAAREGHTTLIYQAEEIQENFYDLFNQRFLCINAPGTDEKVLFANVAIGTIIKPTRVSPFFNCAVIINNSDKSKTSKPFLNRFEKYNLSHEVLFQESLSSCQYHIKNILVYAKKNVEDFVKNCGDSCFYGFTEQTIDSLMLLVLPTQHVTDSTDVSSIGADFECSSKVDSLALCLLRQYHLVCGTCIDLGHYELFSEAVSFAIDSISQNDRDMVQNFLDDPIDYESINKVARMAVKDNEVSSQFSLKLLQELVVIFLHYQLMRIMSPEGLVTCCGTDGAITDFYKKCYIRYQHHFSLHDFIQEQYQLLDKRKEFVAKKFLCFTHTSQSIMEMIPTYSSCYLKCTQEKKKMQEFLCFDEERKFHTYVMSHATSQEKIQDTLRIFLECNDSSSPTEVLLLFANMNELSKDTINHARILIEETECFYQQLHCNKLIFFILHFPPQMFYNYCYPTLFLDGWQHVYFDEIGEMKGVQYINIEKWLDICLLENSTASSQYKMCDIFVNDFVWTDLLSETIVLSFGNITMKQLKDFPPKDPELEEKCLYWTKILKIDKMSSVLSKRFYSFWQQKAMHELTFKIARYAVTYHSSCTLSQAVEETIKSSYKELVLYFICIMNQQFVIHSLHQHNESIVPNTKLICKILSILPIPDSLQQLQLEVAILTQQSHIDTAKDFSSPKIPFFNLIFDAMENIINQVFKQYMQSVDINSEEGYLENSEMIWAQEINSASSDTDHIIQRTEELIRTSKDDCLIINFAIEAMTVNEEFWDYYLEDSLSRKLSRDVCIFTKQFFNLASIQSDDFTRRMVSLHYNLRLYKLDSQYLSLLRLLDESICYIDTYHVESELLKNLNKKSVLTTCIDVFYASLESLHRSGKCAKFFELSHLFYQMISKFKLCDDLDLHSATKKKWVVLSIIYFVNNLKLRDEIILLPFYDFILKLMEAANISKKYIKAKVLAELVQKCFTDVWHSHLLIFEHIMEYYVNHYIHDITDEDIRWMWEVMNRTELNQDLSSSWLQSKFRYHLGKLLEKPQKTHSNGTRELSGLLLFDDRVRSILGLVIDSKDPSSCFNYYPYDYRNCTSLKFKLQKSINVPLCDVYYDIVLEKLQSYDSSISDMVLFSNMLTFYERLAESIDASETCQSVKKLLVIEKQAVIQTVIEKLAHIVVQHDGSTDDIMVDNLFDIIEKVLGDSNAVSKYSTAAISDNSLTLLMRILQVCRNERKLKVKLVDNIDIVSLLTSFKCIRQISTVLKFHQIQKEHFLPFLSRCYSSQMSIFNSVHDTMKSIIKYPGKKQKIEPIHCIAVKCNASKQEKLSFIMSVFLSTHIEFFVNKKNSHRILPILFEELFQYIGKEYWYFIDWMANPMPDSITSLSNQELHNFFVQPNEDNQMHIQCLIELAAVVLGSSSDSHFWIHLFEPNYIKMDFLPGSMITGCVNAKYLKVMSLKDTPINYTYRMSLNWSSLLILQWMNYGLLCIAMVVNSTRYHQDLVNPICFDGLLPSPEEALSQLNVIWEKIAIDCNITIDERDHLMFSCIQNLYKVLLNQELVSHWSILSSQNTCTNQDEFLQALCQYEMIIHTKVFVPSWKSMKQREHFNRFGDPIVHHLRELRKNVKQLQIHGGTPFDDFLSILLSSTMLHDRKCELFTLYQFILTRPALNIGAIVLPKLVDLYSWIHNNLQFKVTSEIAKSQSVRTVLESLLDQFFPGKKVKEMAKIEVLIKQYDKYRHFSKCLPEISIDMKFYHLLHMINGSKDVLFKAITDIVERYNSFLDDHQLHNSAMKSLIPVTEVTEETCLFANLISIEKLSSYRNLQDLKTIILKHCSLRNTGRNDPESDSSMIVDCIPEVFHFKAIQNEIISLFISHKQKISLQNFWKKFDFHKSMQEISPQSLFHSSVHYKEVIEMIKTQYPHLAKSEKDEVSTLNGNTDPNDEALLPSVTELENIFHSLNHNSLVTLCSGLFLILQKILEKIPNCDDTHINSMGSLTVCQFLSESCSDMNDALKHVGIVKHSAAQTRSSLNDNQYKFISDMHLNTVVYLTKFFQDWLEIGYYDFHHLPFCMKIHLVEDVQQDITEWTQNQETMKIVTDLANLMFKFEKDLEEKACYNSDTAIGEVFKEELYMIPDWLPKLSVKYYVHIHLELRKKLFERDQQPESRSDLSEIPLEEVTPQKECTPPPIGNTSPIVINPSLPQTIVPVSFLNVNDTKESELRKLAENKTAEDVAEFMDAEGFHDSAAIVNEDEDMDGLVVYDSLSDDEELRKEFALCTALQRLKFRILFKRWLTNSFSLLGKISPDEVAQQFERHKKLKQFCEVIKIENIDGEMIAMAQTHELQDLGITGIQCTIVQKVVKEMKEQLQVQMNVMCPVCNYEVETASASLQCLSCLHCMHKECYKKLKPQNCPVCCVPIQFN